MSSETGSFGSGFAVAGFRAGDVAADADEDAASWACSVLVGNVAEVAEGEEAAAVDAGGAGKGFARVDVAVVAVVAVVASFVSGGDCCSFSCLSCIENMRRSWLKRSIWSNGVFGLRRSTDSTTEKKGNESTVAGRHFLKHQKGM